MSREELATRGMVKFTLKYYLGSQPSAQDYYTLYHLFSSTGIDAQRWPDGAIKHSSFINILLSEVCRAFFKTYPIFLPAFALLNQLRKCLLRRHESVTQENRQKSFYHLIIKHYHDHNLVTKSSYFFPCSV